MNKIAIIGGSRFGSLKNLKMTHSTSVITPYGEPSAPLCYGMLGDKEVVFLQRRGQDKPISPHQVNYRANLWALRDAGVQTVISAAAVTAATDSYHLGEIMIPDQLIDYTYGRENTFFGEGSNVNHINFSYPYDEALRQTILHHASILGYPVIASGTYGITQGPRLESVAESNM